MKRLSQSNSMWVSPRWRLPYHCCHWTTYSKLAWSTSTLAVQKFLLALRRLHTTVVVLCWCLALVVLNGQNVAVLLDIVCVAISRRCLRVICTLALAALKFCRQIKQLKMRVCGKASKKSFTSLRKFCRIPLPALSRLVSQSYELERAKCVLAT